MRNIKITVEYAGINYRGWQRQKNAFRTVQQTIEAVLRRILKERIRLIASGRTDVGVHGLGQVANFKTKSRIPLANLKQALNSLLPDDVAIIKAQEVALNFHSRFNAKSKIYRYIILNQKYPSALWRNFTCFIPYKLDIKAMQSAARLLLGRRDFRSFQAADDRIRGSIRRIKRIKIYRSDYFIPHLPPFPCKAAASKGARFIYLDIEADGFLYKMVRNIAGTLIEVGRGRMRPSDMKETLALKSRKFAGPTAPGHGLYLLLVKY